MQLSSETEEIDLYADTWNEATVKAAWDPNTPAELKPPSVYGASKTEGERAAWKWIKENKPGFVFNAILPNFNVRFPFSLSRFVSL
jgi:hypothetical protein